MGDTSDKRCEVCGAAAGPEAGLCAECGSAHRWLPKKTGSAGDREVGATTTDVGRVLGSRFELVGLLGRGAMGEVYRARERGLEREVAIKFLAEDMRDRPEMLERFLVEARGAAQVEHPSVVTIYTTGQECGRPYIVMRYVRGDTVSKLLERHGPLPSHLASKLICEVCDGLALIHERGLVHRDLKPQNLMVDERGRCVILDFGILRFQDSTTTSTGLSFGSPAYMSPEQSRDARRADARSDLYSMGVTVWEMLTGSLPYRGSTAVEVILQHLSAPVPALPMWLGSRARMQTFLGRALAKSPDERFQSARDFAGALRAALGPGDVDRPIETSSGGSRASGGAAWRGPTPLETTDVAPRAAISASGVHATNVAGETTASVSTGGRRKRLAVGGAALSISTAALLWSLLSGDEPDEVPRPSRAPHRAILPESRATAFATAPSLPQRTEASAPIVVSPAEGAQIPTPAQDAGVSAAITILAPLPARPKQVGKGPRGAKAPRRKGTSSRPAAASPADGGIPQAESAPRQRGSLAVPVAGEGKSSESTTGILHIKVVGFDWGSGKWRPWYARLLVNGSRVGKTSLTATEVKLAPGACRVKAVLGSREVELIPRPVVVRGQRANAVVRLPKELTK